IEEDRILPGKFQAGNPNIEKWFAAIRSLKHLIRYILDLLQYRLLQLVNRRKVYINWSDRTSHLVRYFPDSDLIDSFFFRNLKSRFHEFLSRKLCLWCHGTFSFL